MPPNADLTVGMSKHQQQETDEASFEALFLADGTKARAPSLDLEDEDVVGLGEVEQTAQIIETPEDEDLVGDLPYGSDELGWDEPPELTVAPLSGRGFAAVAPRRRVRAPSRSGKLLPGFLLLNVVVIGGLFMTPSLRDLTADPGPMGVGAGSPTPREVSPTGARVVETPLLPPVSADVGLVPGADVPIAPSPIGETSAPQVLASADESIARGDYEGAQRLLEAKLGRQPSSDRVGRRATYTSLAYCAERRGHTVQAEHFNACAASLALLDMAPENAWSEARELQQLGAVEPARRLYARLLLQQDTLAERWSRGGLGWTCHHGDWGCLRG